MNSHIYYYPLVIKESYIDLFGHMNNATYLKLFEEARWDFITKNGYGLEKMRKEGLGPTILEINIRYFKEILLRDEIVIETQLISYENKIGKIQQKMLKNTDVCCVALFTIGLFSLKERKLILPPADWLRAIGVTLNI